MLKCEIKFNENKKKVIRQKNYDGHNDYRNKLKR